MSKTALAQPSRLEGKLQTAKTLDEVTSVIDQAEALRILSKKIGKSLEKQNIYAEIKLRAQRRAGEMIDQTELHPGGRPKNLSSERTGFEYVEKITLKEAGYSRNQSANYQAIYRIPEEKFEETIQKTKDAGKEITEIAMLRIAKEEKREAIREHNRALVERAVPATVHVAGARYQTIVIDPPWDWGDEGDVDQFGRGRPTYATMGIEEVAALPVADLSEKDAHLYLWITNRSLPKGFALLEDWGFRYVTALTWCKPSIGMGNYFRGTTEHVLFGVKGSLELLRNDVGTWFQAPRPDRHSAKPPEFFQLVEECSPGPWLEMFAREPRLGWAFWGAEV